MKDFNKLFDARRKKVDKILKDLDVVNIYTVMEVLDWKWVCNIEYEGDEGSFDVGHSNDSHFLRIPQPHEILLEAKRIVEECFAIQADIGTGGFRATYIPESDDVELMFVVSESCSCVD